MLKSHGFKTRITGVVLFLTPEPWPSVLLRQRFGEALADKNASHPETHPPN